MKTILGIDASTERCSVALMHHGQTYLRTSEKVRAHAEVLLSMVDDLLREQQLSIKNLNSIACSAGPGSFTGLRIAFSTAQGLAYGLKLPLFMVDSLQVLAASVTKSSKTHKLCVLDARMNEVYWSVMSLTGQVVAPTQLSLPMDVFKQLQNFDVNSNSMIACGNGVGVLEDSNPDAFKALGFLETMIDAYPQADALLRVANERLLEGQMPAVEAAELSYLRDSVSWNKRKRIRQVTK